MRLLWFSGSDAKGDPAVACFYLPGPLYKKSKNVASDTIRSGRQSGYGNIELMGKIILGLIVIAFIVFLITYNLKDFKVLSQKGFGASLAYEFRVKITILALLVIGLAAIVVFNLIR